VVEKKRVPLVSIPANSTSTPTEGWYSANSTSTSTEGWYSANSTSTSTEGWYSANSTSTPTEGWYSANSTSTSTEGWYSVKNTQCNFSFLENRICQHVVWISFNYSNGSIFRIKNLFGIFCINNE